VTKQQRLVVVDGSNLATEGRTTPSLRQLSEAVQAFLQEHADHEVVVVVDATFEHRIAAAERTEFNQAELAGEVVTPPAGVVGRGDAFILKIAQRANAIVLSNDSFQEFHAEHPWLFEEGRLVGGKPVPHVGWIFTPRNPVRGVKSKVATTRAARAAKVAALAPASAEAAEAVEPAPKRRRTAKQAATNTDQVSVVAKAPGREPAKPAKPPRKRTAKASPAAASATSKATGRAAAKSTRATAVAPRPSGAKESAKASSRRSRPTKEPAAVKEAAPTTKARLEPVNTPRSFLRLVADHKVGGVVDGEVVQFTSHGAMVSVPVGRTMHVVCYAPLAGLGSPAPTRARDVLQKGEVYRFAIVSFDTTRRRAELALSRR
jgi:Zc3h12a-like Ribonuclease NYN domain